MTFAPFDQVIAWLDANFHVTPTSSINPLPVITALASGTPPPGTFEQVPAFLNSIGQPVLVTVTNPMPVTGGGGGSGITQLTGDVTAGPGSGSQASTLASTAVSAGSYTNASLNAITFPANFGDFGAYSSEAGGTANATASTVIDVDQAASATPNTFTTIGTITIGSGSVSPTFATISGTAKTFAKGDVMRLIGPSSADATFANFYATLVGHE